MLRLTDVAIGYDSQTVVDNLDLHLEAGQIGCLLGASGCGKTSILRAIAGFQEVIRGQISLRSNVVSKPNTILAAQKRNIGVVFKDYALFPHMTVAQNIAFGLHRLSKDERQQRVRELLNLVGLNGLEERYPHGLSGGQQQRVALVRAMAPKPDLLLLDEPFSSLDSELREALAIELRSILKHENTTALLVTHDQHEAFAMADVIGVMHQGKLMQWADAYTLYHQPNSKAVANFIGEGVLLAGKVAEHKQIACALGTFNQTNQQTYSVGQSVSFLIRPDDIILDPSSAIRATVIDKAFRGSHIWYRLQLLSPDTQQQVICLAPSHHNYAIHESLGIRLDLKHLIVFAD